ncbi:unnamed protein product [Microthlaspi erraticum]|uniref:Uncharacterized protein n=1 Tax=Microthlaspi erraticum TaxID=1685480 RepID=A0A6D2HYW3_9BRAS|nr:unnamed protein product [Microthlaspi erraticum]
MMVSMEALAMAGSDYQEWGLSIDEWGLQESVVPPHLLADDFQEEDHPEDDDRVPDGVAVIPDVTCDILASLGKFIEQSMSHIVVVHLKHLKFLRLLENFLFSHVFEFLL